MKRLRFRAVRRREDYAVDARFHQAAQQRLLCVEALGVLAQNRGPTAHCQRRFDTVDELCKNGFPTLVTTSPTESVRCARRLDAALLYT